MSSNDPFNLSEFSRKLDIIFDNFKASLFGELKEDKSSELKYYDEPYDEIETFDTGKESFSECSSEIEELLTEIEINVTDRKILGNKRPEIRKYFKTKVYLDVYPPSKEIKLAHANQFTKELFVNNKDFYNYLNLPILEAHNSHHIFNVLLQMEDLTTMTTYVPLALNDVILNTTTTRGQYWIAIENTPTIDQVLTPYIDEVVIVPKASAISSTQAVIGTDLLLPHADENSVEVERRRHIATVEQVSKDRVYFRFHPKENANLSVFISKYDIIFRPRRLPMRYQYRALELYAEDSEMRNFLFPTTNVRCEELPNTE